MRARNDQLGVGSRQASKNAAAESVPEQDSVIFSLWNRVDACLDVCPTSTRRVVMALGKKLEIDDIRATCGGLAKLPDGDFTSDEFEEHGRTCLKIWGGLGAEIRSPKSEIRKKPETRNPRSEIR